MTEPHLQVDTVTVVVPCFNEAKRLDTAEILRLCRAEGIRVLLVDDGSTDATASILTELCAISGGRAAWLQLECNRGKAEAVRRGLLRALAEGAACVAFLDADLSTPVDEMQRLVEILRSRPEVAVVLASRIRLLGNAVQRKPVRHYLGRMFATAASLALDLAIYDTQCGAKLFRRSPALQAALAQPFSSRWIFDVELIGRLLSGTPDHERVPQAAFAEVPLLAWRDVAGSKLKPRHMALAIGELISIQRHLKQRRSGVLS